MALCLWYANSHLPTWTVLLEKVICGSYLNKSVELKYLSFFSYSRVSCWQSRVVQLACGERSYHIFYQLCAGSSPDLKGVFLCNLSTSLHSFILLCHIWDLNDHPWDNQFKNDCWVWSSKYHYPLLFNFIYEFFINRYFILNGNSLTPISAGNAINYLCLDSVDCDSLISLIGLVDIFSFKIIFSFLVQINWI